MDLSVNGKTYKVSVPDDTALLWVLREELGLVGTKFGCGQGLCGACTVHIDGQATRSCVFPVSGAVRTKITTIEGIAAKNKHAVRDAWIMHNVPQCGYCQPGQIMNATAFLTRVPSPTEKQINEAMSGNICRCGTYPRIRKAIMHAARTLAKQKAEP